MKKNNWEIYQPLAGQAKESPLVMVMMIVLSAILIVTAEYMF